MTNSVRRFVRNILLFIHIIAAMVFFGLPFTFGRWFRIVVSHGNDALIQATLQRFRWFSYYLHGAAVILLITGIWLATISHFWSLPGQRWIHLALPLMAVSFFNLLYFLGPAISSAADLAKTKRGLVFFSSIHHTVVTLLTMLMVFKPF